MLTDVRAGLNYTSLKAEPTEGTMTTMRLYETCCCPVPLFKSFPVLTMCKFKEFVKAGLLNENTHV